MAKKSTILINNGIKIYPQTNSKIVEYKTNNAELWNVAKALDTIFQDISELKEEAQFSHNFKGYFSTIEELKSIPTSELKGGDFAIVKNSNGVDFFYLWDVDLKSWNRKLESSILSINGHTMGNVVLKPQDIPYNTTDSLKDKLDNIDDKLEKVEDLDQHIINRNLESFKVIYASETSQNVVLKDLNTGIYVVPTESDIKKIIFGIGNEEFCNFTQNQSLIINIKKETAKNEYILYFSNGNVYKGSVASSGISEYHNKIIDNIYGLLDKEGKQLITTSQFETLNGYVADLMNNTVKNNDDTYLFAQNERAISNSERGKIVHNKDLESYALKETFLSESERLDGRIDTTIGMIKQEEWDSKLEQSDLDNYATIEQLNSKVDKENGKGLSTNDFTTEEKNKLAGLENYDGRITNIENLIPSEASATNQLADKEFVNSLSAFYITKNINGDAFSNLEELNSATTYYSGGKVRTPTRNDYCIVREDENNNNSTTRYIYQNGWEFQYIVNETALTDSQLSALNSGITSEKVSQIDLNSTAIANKADKSEIPTDYVSNTDEVYEFAKNEYELTKLNILHLYDASGTRNGVTYEAHNGVITLNGTATGAVDIPFLYDPIQFDGNTYLGVDTNDTQVFLPSEYTNYFDVSNEFKVQKATTFNTYSKMYVRIASGRTYNNVYYKPIFTKHIPPTTFVANNRIIHGNDLGEVEQDVKTLKNNMPTKVSQLTNDEGYITIDDLPPTLVVDDHLSETSTNPVQNKRITEEFSKVEYKDEQNPVIRKNTLDSKGYALDSKVVHKDSEETISGKKIFSNSGNEYSLNSIDNAVVNLIGENGDKLYKGTNKITFDGGSETLRVNNISFTGSINSISASSLASKDDIKTTVSSMTDAADYVKNTTYATDNTTGVIKSGNGLNVDNTGKVSASSLTFNDYQNNSNNTFVSKGTLENVLTNKNYATKSDISSVYRVKGTKTWSELIAITNAQVGDVYNVSDKNGANYVCVVANTAGESSWDKLGDTVDLSGYVQKTRTINNKSLETDISLTAQDVGALSSSTPYVASLNGQSGDVSISIPPDLVGYQDAIDVTGNINPLGNYYNKGETDSLLTNYALTGSVPKTYVKSASVTGTTLKLVDQSGTETNFNGAPTNYVTTDTEQTITAKKTISTNGDGLEVVGTGNSSSPSWQGRIIAGSSNAKFLMGEYRGMAGVGAHNGALNAWEDFYLNPDGAKDVVIGYASNGWDKNDTGIIRVKNSDHKAYYKGNEIATKNDVPTFTLDGTTLIITKEE